MGNSINRYEKQIFPLELQDPNLVFADVILTDDGETFIILE